MLRQRKRPAPRAPHLAPRRAAGLLSRPSRARGMDLRATAAGAGRGRCRCAIDESFLKSALLLAFGLRLAPAAAAAPGQGGVFLVDGWILTAADLDALGRHGR